MIAVIFAIMIRGWFFIVLLSGCMAAAAAVPDDNVVIVEGSEEYKIVAAPTGFAVKNSITHVYEATRRAGRISPHIFYNDVITLDKASGGRAEYRNANSPAVFHDDSKVCFFNINLSAKGKKAKVEFRRTFTDMAYFTKVFMREDCPVRSKKVVFKIPASMPGITLTDCNFPAGEIVRSDETDSDGGRTITYLLSGLQAANPEPGAPPAMRGEPYVLIGGYFPDVDSLYRYHRPKIDVDTLIPNVGALLAEITAGAADDVARIAAIYKYVQRSVRYVAFEEGEAGYRPDSPAEVLRKRYGDCKGMALLLAALLNRTGIDADVAIVGTRRIPFGISELPSLAATDHMVCAVPLARGMMWLDATAEYISPVHVPYGIQGKEALVFKPGGYELCRLPVLGPEASVDSLDYRYVMIGGELAGMASRTLTGDMEEYFMAGIDGIEKHMQSEALARALIPGTRAAVDADVMTFDAGEAGRAVLSAPIRNPHAVVDADGVFYLDLNTTDTPMAVRVDLDDRQSDFELPMRARVVRRSSVTLPKNCSVTYLPENYRDVCDQGTLSCSFESDGSSVVMTKVLEITRPEVPLAEIAGWNKALSEWSEACNRQVEITITH